MKNFVVGIYSTFDGELKLFKQAAETDFDAVKRAMVDLCQTEEARASEVEYQKSFLYPANIPELLEIVGEQMPFSVIEI